LVDSAVGIGFGKLATAMKLSRKDLLLVLGIVVAIVVTLTTIAYSEQNAYLPGIEQPVKKTNLGQAAGELIRKSLHRALQPVGKR